jgi:hypothetical protein
MTTLQGTAAGAGAAIQPDLPDLVFATPDGADPMLDPAVAGILRLVREHLDMDVVFIAEYLEGHNVFRRVQATPEFQAFEGQSQLRADSFCQRVLDGRLPAVIPDVAALRGTHDVPDTPLPIGAYMAAPVQLADGTVYGTLCCFSFEPRAELGEREYKRLQMSARLTARLIDESHGRVTFPPA